MRAGERVRDKIKQLTWLQVDRLRSTRGARVGIALLTDFLQTLLLVVIRFIVGKVQLANAERNFLQDRSVDSDGNGNGSSSSGGGHSKRQRRAVRETKPSVNSKI